MATIISARFQLQTEAQDMVNKLLEQRYSPGSIATFYLNSAGQHALYPIGGDRDKSPGAEQTDTGALKGASIGAMIGVSIGSATIPITGTAGPMLGSVVGAHIGSLMGSLNATQEENDIKNDDSKNRLRKAGFRVAISIKNFEQEKNVIAEIKIMRGHDIEKSQGKIINGIWLDFDPLSTPIYIANSKSAITQD